MTTNILSARQRPATAQCIERLAPDVVLLQLQLSDDTDFSYKAGQFIAIHLPGGATRCYSMARRPVPGAPLEFHIRLQSNGVFSYWLKEALANPLLISNTPLMVSGPFGDCIWDDQDSERATILLGTGTGIAPLAALVEERLAKEATAPITLYWGGRRANDFYCANTFATMALQYRNFRFVPVIDSPDAGWDGRCGFVQDCAAHDFPDLGAVSVYACGSPQMVRSARQKLITQCDLNPDHFYADAFEPSEQALYDDEMVSQILTQVRLANGEEKALMLPRGVSLMTALRAEGLIKGICGGQKSCGSCRVEIAPSWSARLPTPDRAETRLLAALEDPTPADRLACQIALTPALDGLEFAILDRPL